MYPISSQPGSSNLGQLFSSTVPVLALVWCFNASMLQDWSVQTHSGPLKQAETGRRFSTDFIPTVKSTRQLSPLLLPTCLPDEVRLSKSFTFSTKVLQNVEHSCPCRHTEQHVYMLSFVFPLMLYKGLLVTYNTYRESLPTLECADNILCTVFKSKLCL